MAVRAALRFEPVACVVTVIVGDDGRTWVLDMMRGTQIAVQHPDQVEERYTEVQGSVVYVGPDWPADGPAQMAAVLELPGGRLRLAGGATIRRRAGVMEFEVTGRDEDGCEYRIRGNADCRPLMARSIG